MISKNFNGVTVSFPEEMTKMEVLYAIGKTATLKPKSELKSMVINIDKDNNLDINYKFEEPKFERIRRITGYLVGTTDRWNNSKKAELKDRVKHSAN